MITNKIISLLVYFLKLLGVNTGVVLDPVQEGSNASENAWPANFTAQGNAEGCDADQSTFLVVQDQRTAGIAIAGGETSSGLNANVGGLDGAQEPGVAARVAHDWHINPLQFVSSTSGLCNSQVNYDLSNLKSLIHSTYHR